MPWGNGFLGTNQETAKALEDPLLEEKQGSVPQESLKCGILKLGCVPGIKNLGCMQCEHKV